MEHTKIQWADHTFNPWIGCTKVSEGCKNCYAEALDKRFGKRRWGSSAPRERTSEANWRKPLLWNKKAQEAGERHRVFCASLADVFDAEVPQKWRNDLWSLIVATPSLDWLLLTKRPQNARWDGMMPRRWLESGTPANVWVGTSVEDQQTAEKRIPLLLDAPAPVRFLSLEPLLGPVDLTRLADDVGARDGLEAGIHWVIVGGESGPGARPCEVEWIRSIVDQCRLNDVPVFVKQLGSRAGLTDPKGGDPAEWPMDLRVREFPAQRGGR